MKKYFILFFLTINFIHAQSTRTNFPKLTGPYLGQKPPGMTPELFAPGIVSTSNHEHSRIEFSKDGKEMFWSVTPIVEGKFQGEYQKIWHTQMSEIGWTRPKVLPIQLTKFQAPVIHPISEDLFFFSKDTIWQKKIKDTSWNNLIPVKDLVPQILDKYTMSFCFASNGNLYYDLGGPNKIGQWNWSIYYRELKNGMYSEPVLLGNNINGARVNWCPFVSPDENYIIFSSDGANENDVGDLFICFKQKDGTWGMKINMGDKINTSSQERFPSLSPDGKHLFFARHTDRKTYSDYYWVSAKIIEELKQKVLGVN